MHVLAILLAIAAVACMIAAIAWMVTGRGSDREGWTIRAVAVGCFVAAVLLNIAAH
jgi:dolichyl-phosphate-mannose--protein O-mannosyl transferase